MRENARYFAALYGMRPRADATRPSPTSASPTARRQLVGHALRRAAGRVSLACAPARRPELLVLDEPTVGLDPVLRLELWERFHALAAAGTTLIVSSHVMDEAGRCDRLLLLRDGRLLADATPRSARRRPAPTTWKRRSYADRAGARRPVEERADMTAAARRPGPDGRATGTGARRIMRGDRAGRIVTATARRVLRSCATTGARSRCCWSCPACCWC